MGKTQQMEKTMNRDYGAGLLHVIIMSGKTGIVETTHGRFEGEIRNLNDDGYVVIIDDEGNIILIPKDTVKVIHVKEKNSEG